MKYPIEYDNMTGLLFVNEVPFTQQMVDRIARMLIQNNNLFEYEVLIKDIGGSDSFAVIDKDVLADICTYIAKHKLTLANDEDFN